MILVGGEHVNRGNAGGQTENQIWKLLDHPVLVASAHAFKEAGIQRIRAPFPSGNEDFDRRPTRGGATEMESNPKFVYVFQKEYCAVSPLFAEFAGTDEITTCIGLVIRDPSSGLTSIGHFDTPDCVVSGVNKLLDAVISMDNSSLQVHLVGAFDDSSDYVNQEPGTRPTSVGLVRDSATRHPGWSWPLALRMIEVLESSAHYFEVETCIILKHNTSIGDTGHPCPTFRGCVVETSSGRFRAASFEPESRGPDGTVRGVCTTTISAVPNWVATLATPYQTDTDTFVITPFKWSSSFERYALYMLTLPDAAFLDTFSTSPHAEGPDFLTTNRRIFTYMKNFPSLEQSFPRDEPRVFTRTVSGGWVKQR